MNLRINSHHVEVTPAMKTHLEEKVVRIKKHFDQVIDISAMLVVDKANQPCGIVHLHDLLRVGVA